MINIASENGPIAGVIGQPIAHSLSPLIHTTWLKRFGLSGRYDRREIAPDRFAEDVRALLTQEGWVGMNVTLPHKQAAYEFCDCLDDSAQRLGAVNTIVTLPDGRFEGRNTDLYGFRTNLEQAEGWGRTGRGIALVLGAGGAARAVVAALQDLGFADICITNRTMDKAEALVETLTRSGDAPLRAVDWSDIQDLLASCDLLVNTTSLGMVGQPELKIDLTSLPQTAFVTDIVYKPLETALLAQARAQGNPVVDGLGMLLYQAVPGFQAWFNPPTAPQVDSDLRAIVLGAMAS
ncbi:MAG: shikimate dehydrogenase [Alphaproteobacteria bacterium]|nr:shikimate dehydrogenase [Alphaproteobacteria bacterium]